MRTWNSSILGLKEPILIGCVANAPWRQSSDGSYVMTPTIVRIQPLGPNSTRVRYLGLLGLVMLRASGEGLLQRLDVLW
jgi:hypothetical protein